MSILDNLTTAEAPAKAQGYDPVRLRRRKLASALQDQLRLLQSEEAGEAYRRVRVSRKRDLETDEVFEVEQQRRVTPWWWVDDEGKVRFSIRYGATRLKLKDGKDVIVVASTAALGKLLPQLRQEVLTGGMDEMLSAAATELEARFKTRKPASK